jgi:hypothetical protein
MNEVLKGASLRVNLVRFYKESKNLSINMPNDRKLLLSIVNKVK